MDQLTTLLFLLIGFLFFYSFYKVAEKIDRYIKHKKRMRIFYKTYIKPYKKNK